MYLGEIKNVQYQRMTNQLNDFMQYTQRERLSFHLWLPPAARVSGELQGHINNGAIIRHDLIVGQ